MGRFDPYSRRTLRRLRRTWLRRNLFVVTVLVVGLVVTLAIVTAVLLIGADGPVRWYVLGALHAGLVVGALHILHSVFLAHDREAIRHVRGAWGEENTRSELRRAKRRRVIWGWVDSISLQAGDLDHVVVTRRAGLVTIDSKWRNELTPTDVADMTRDALRAKSRAEGLARTLLTSERHARHRARVQALPVTSVVVLWGAAQTAVPENAVREGIRFLAGRELVPWLRGIDGDPVAKDAAGDMLRRLRDYRAAAWQDA